MNEVVPMIPASGKVLWVLGPISLVLIILLALFGYITYSSKNVEFELSEQGLRIRGDIYGRLIPAESLLAERAKPVDLRRETSHQPKRRTNGVGLPGYRSGWFRLRNGEKALLFVTDPSSVAYVPTRDGYSVLLSVRRPERFLESLRKLGN